MTISKDLFLSILALDSYNRGYLPRLQLLSTDIGLAHIGSEANTPDAQAAGFYAISYDVGSVSGFSAGQKVISYRGTDNYNPNPLDGTSDVWSGWVIGAGYSTASQAGLAGFISSLSGSEGVGFDYMPFGIAAWDARASAGFRCGRALGSTARDRLDLTT